MVYGLKTSTTQAEQSIIDAINSLDLPSNCTLAFVYRLRDVINRIDNEILCKSFAIPEDRKYWEERLTKLNRQLYVYESQGVGY